MDHPVAVEEVVAGDWLEQRVGAVADVDAVEAAGNAAGDGEAVLDGVLGHRSEVSGYLDGGVGRPRQAAVELARQERVLDHVQGGSCCSLQQVPVGSSLPGGT